MNTFLTVDGEWEATIEIKKSVFICHAKGIEDYDEGLEYVKSVAAKYPDARHNCYAFLTSDGRQKFSDNGEPQGTAGLPMTEVIKKKGLTDVACVVTRYFGGIKLGTGGLAAAYSQATKDALDKAVTVRKTESVVRTAELDYSVMKGFTRLMEDFGAVVSVPEYGNKVTVTFYFPAEREEEWLEKEREFSCGKTLSVMVEKKIMKYKI